jgi:hypothetical protein
MAANILAYYGLLVIIGANLALKRLPDFCANIRLRMKRKMIIGYAPSRRMGKHWMRRRHS